MGLIADSMSVNRFEEIKRFIYFVNNENKDDRSIHNVDTEKNSDISVLREFEIKEHGNS